MIRLSIAVAIVLASACTGRGCGAGPATRGALTLATTTSVGNSGLLDALLPAYGESARVDVRPLLIGSGLALKMLADGHADLVISHSPVAEHAALRDHPRWTYRKLMFNDFVLVGPVDDPAKVAGATNVIDAMRRIAGSPSRFISRGDQSGTHEREQQLWARAGVTPTPGRLIAAGAGMGSTLRVASETGAYALSDRATYAQLASSLDLMVRFEGGTLLLNTYAVIFDPAAPHATSAAALAQWLSDGDGRRRIERYRVAGGVQAFRVWPEGRRRTRPEDDPF
ncbi:MAG TPA: substrate-binding domain-containing protein [Vicinamibacterales bacterium]|nr:substrate-binding domain-containing protein [Vicinamibacterales bacterium]